MPKRRHSTSCSRISPLSVPSSDCVSTLKPAKSPCRGVSAKDAVVAAVENELRALSRLPEPPEDTVFTHTLSNAQWAVLTGECDSPEEAFLFGLLVRFDCQSGLMEIRMGSEIHETAAARIWSQLDQAVGIWRTLLGVGTLLDVLPSHLLLGADRKGRRSDGSILYQGRPVFVMEVAYAQTEAKVRQKGREWIREYPTVNCVLIMKIGYNQNTGRCIRMATLFTITRAPGGLVESQPVVLPLVPALPPPAPPRPPPPALHLPARTLFGHGCPDNLVNMSIHLDLDPVRDAMIRQRQWREGEEPLPTNAA